MIKTTIEKPKKLDLVDWADLQELQGLELATQMPDLDVALISQQVGAPTEAGQKWFADRSIDPNNHLTSAGYRAAQAYSRPRMAIARDNIGQILGFGLGANNVSGSPFARLIKTSGIVKDKKYLWIEGIHVSPEKTESQLLIAHQIGARLLASGGERPVSTYVWPENGGARMFDVYKSWGFNETSDQVVTPFGPDGPSVNEIRLQVASASLALNKLLPHWQDLTSRPANG